MATKLIAELVVLTQRLDKLGDRVHKLDPLAGELLMNAADCVVDASRILNYVLEGELTACENCGCTIEDGECIC